MRRYSPWVPWALQLLLYSCLLVAVGGRTHPPHPPPPPDLLAAHLKKEGRRARRSFEARAPPPFPSRPLMQAERDLLRQRVTAENKLLPGANPLPAPPWRALQTLARVTDT